MNPEWIEPDDEFLVEDTIKEMNYPTVDLLWKRNIRIEKPIHPLNELGGLLATK